MSITMHASLFSRAGGRAARGGVWHSLQLRHGSMMIASSSRTLCLFRTTESTVCPIHRHQQAHTPSFHSYAAASFSTTSSPPPSSVDTVSSLVGHLEPNSLLLELHQRGLLADVTNPPACVKWINTPTSNANSTQSSSSFSPSTSASTPQSSTPFVPRVVYAGFDPTASSLHVGNLLVLMALRRFQQWGHKPICVVGGATGMIGDPSGRSTERNMLSEEQLQRNIDGITKDIKKFLRFDESAGSAAINSSSGSKSPSTTSTAPFNNGALLVNNLDWFRGQTLISFLRDTGRHFRLSQMLARDSVASRLHSDAGMSFTEFTYQTLQAYDFMHLHKSHNVSLQIGGSDQWGNITAGVELIKREATNQEPTNANKKLSEPQVFGLTLPLLTTASGQKFGKSMGNAPIWLSSDASSPNSSSPYQFYQYFLNSTADADLVRFLRLFTDLSLPEIGALEKEYLTSGKANGSRELAKKLAEEVTSIVHGEEGLKQAQQTTEMLFAKKNGTAFESSSSNSLSAEQFLQLFQGAPILTRSSTALFSPSPKPIVDLCVEMGVTKTKAEARRLIAQGGLNLNDVKITNDAKLLEPADLATKGHADKPSEQIKVAVFRSGKKKQFVLVVRD